MKLVVNGRSMALPDGTTVSGLVERLGLRVTSVVVEYNGEALTRDRYPSTVLAEGDVVEVVRPVQGGASLPDARLYLVCDSAFPRGRLAEVVAAGVDVVQLREKDAPAAAVVKAGEGFREVCRRAGVPFIVNDRPDLALALEADGVHLGQDDVGADVARRILGPAAIIGRSTHSEAQIEAAVREHEAGLADYIAVGPVHATPTKPGRPAVGLRLVRHASEAAAALPWFAIGGIDETNVGAVVDAGASRVVVVRAITQADDPVRAAETLRAALS